MRLWCGVLVVCFSASSAAAQTMALQDVVSDALEHSPLIAAARARYDAANARPSQERSLPDPMVSAGYSANGRPWPGAGLGTEPTSNIGFMVSQTLPYPGKLALKASIASRDAEAERTSIEAARLDITARVKQAYYRLAYTYAASDVLTRNRDLLETLLAVSENRYAVGSAAQQDVIKAQTQVSILELQVQRLSQERLAREGELNALLARPSGSPLGRPDDLQLIPFTLSLDAVLSSAQAHAPALQRDQIMVDRSTLAVASARKDYKPDFGISGGYFYMGSMPPMYEARFDVQIPLQRAKRAAAVAEQQHLLDASKRSLEASRLDVQQRVGDDYQMSQTAARLALLYRDTVLPQARLALESSMASYQTGSVDFLSVLTNFETVLAYEMNYFDELLSYHTAVSRLEAMAGTPLVH